MKLLALAVEHFRCVRKSHVEFGGGLNVLYGPTTSASQPRSGDSGGTLMQTGSKEADEFINWHGSGDPSVELVFEASLKGSGAFGRLSEIIRRLCYMSRATAWIS